MTLKTIFNKAIDRPIEGVIKADDDASLRLEVEEYVLTQEVEKRMESFLDAYNNYEGSNGVWISGFFGSGKSHLLKMMAMLLEDRMIDGISVLEQFLPKCGDNEILRGDIKRAVKIPSKSILFNIDQKADVISKTQMDALLAVFVKVFDEMCGYYGKQGHIAQFERDLDSRNLYEEFKAAYESIAGRAWEVGREQALLESLNIAKAYSKVTDSDEKTAVGILDKYRTQYSVSIEDFAEQINAFIESQAPGFRLNFFVDEVGQYIADNIKLMTNLQTIAESLATKCRGQAWIIVTAQEDMSMVVGEMGKQQGNDFSKIQARFANRMKLTSADVAEVIQKRLLMKNDEGISLLSDIYHQEVNNFKTMFDFADGSQSYRNFTDRDNFIHCYPFIPYQFTLFQSAIQNLSEHNAFEGKHSSVGERSMLGVFQQVAIQISNHEIGQLATFDLMFEGIRTALKSNIQRAVQRAEKHLNNPFAIRVLKSLFLVKYVKEFKPTQRNICILMLGAFNTDMPKLRKKIEEALNLLNQQTYIQRNGEIYEYLTDEEKDVEDDIKNTEVESTDVASELEKLVFDYVVKTRKIRYSENGQDYSFTRKLDDNLHGRQYELAINIISPFYEDADNMDQLKTLSMAKYDELLVVFPNDDRLQRDLTMYKQTEKYIRQNISITQRDAVKRILTDKGFQNRERYAEIQQYIKHQLSKATLLVAGSEVEISSEDAQTRIISGFHALITRTYSNLRMLRGITYTENDIDKCLRHSQDALFGSDATALAESEQEILAFIQSNDRGGVRTTLKSLLEKFEKKPYGWYYAAILCNLANLYARGKVEARVDGNILEDNELENALRNTHGHANVVLSPQVEFTASQVQALKTLYEDFFDAPPHATEAKYLGKETGEKLKDLIHDSEKLAVQSNQYPFLNTLLPVSENLKEFTGKPYTWYLTELVLQEDYLLDTKEAIIDPIRKFMSGAQKGIYDTAREFVTNQEGNSIYIDLSELTAVLNDPQCFKGNSMQLVKSLTEGLDAKLRDQINAELDKAKETINSLKGRLCGMSEYTVLDADEQNKILQKFEELSGSIKNQNMIANIQVALQNFENTTYSNIINRICSPKEVEPKAGETSSPQNTSKPVVSVVPVSSVLKDISFNKAWLTDETDVERYLETIKKALMDEVKQGKKVQI